ncbi:plastocyanin [Kitasatospora sp. NPDC098652]|uniref:plastocyanin n=1 Tax=Kitasatospora sp. NPDC098652 TaxID=3364095 RepID=UPI0038137BE7
MHVAIRNFRFEPAEFTLRPGGTMTVTDHDSTAHTLTAADRFFDTGTIAPGATRRSPHRHSPAPTPTPAPSTRSCTAPLTVT